MVRYLYSGKVATTFLNISELADGTANTIESTLQTFMTDKGIPVSRMVGLGTDGASVMVGRHNGVAAKFTERQPLLESIAFAIDWLLLLLRLEMKLHIFVINSNPSFRSCSTFIVTGQ